MNCLCCGKPLHDTDTELWHKACIKKFFYTKQLPKIDMEEGILDSIAQNGSRNGITVAGVQKKMSINIFSQNNNPRLTFINYPTGYILKPQVKEFNCLPESEHAVMIMAEKTGIATVPHGLLYDGKNYAYITKRIDRIIKGKETKKLAMEDFCQLDNRLTSDKYKGSYERCAKILETYSSMPLLDISELFMRIVFCYVTGNSDMHLKNFSLIEKEDKTGYVLSSAYDLLPVNVLMPEDSEETALTLNGKKNNIRYKDFLAFAENAGINKNAADKMIGKIISMKNSYINDCENSLMSEKQKEDFTNLILKRCAVLE